MKFIGLLIVALGLVIAGHGVYRIFVPMPHWYDSAVFSAYMYMLIGAIAIASGVILYFAARRDERERREREEDFF